MSAGVWKAEECALVLIDYQDSVIADVWERDRRLVELHVRTLATAAVGFGIPIVLSTVAVKMGINTPILGSLAEAVPGVDPIDRTNMNAFEDQAFFDASEGHRPQAARDRRAHDIDLPRLCRGERPCRRVRGRLSRRRGRRYDAGAARRRGAQARARRCCSPNDSRHDLRVVPRLGVAARGRGQEALPAVLRRMGGAEEGSEHYEPKGLV